jgi:gas vesicle protein
VLPLLQELNNLASLAPKNTSGAAASVWDGLLDIIKDAVKAVVDNIITPVKTTITDIKDSLTTSFGNVIQNVKDAVTLATTTISDKVKTEVSNVITQVTTIFNNVKDSITDGFEDIKDAIQDAIGWIRDKLQGIITAIGDIGKTISKALSDTLTTVYNQIKEALINSFEEIGSFLGGIIQEARDWITNAIEGIKTVISNLIINVKEWLSTTYQAIKDFIANLIESLKDTYERVKKTLEDILGEVVTIYKLVIEKISAWWEGIQAKVAYWLQDVVWPKIQGAIDGAKQLVDLGKGIWELMSSGDYQGAFDLLDGFAKGLGIPAPVKTLHAVLSTIAYFWESIKLQFVPLEVAASKHAQINLALDPISIDNAAQGVFRGVMSKEAYFYNASLGGVTKERAQVNFETNRPLPTPGSIQEAFLRGEINENLHDSYMAHYGYSDKDINLIKSLYHLIPPPSDLIRMAVREAFSPDIAVKFGQYEDYPQAFTDWAAKQGIDKDWAERYWASHWDLPSPSMGFEMLHRGIIDDNELKLLLRALDVMPYWRERLIQLSYNPITRVDLRRMYKMGVLDEDDVYRGYLDIGYSPDNAQRLTEFTKRYSAPEDVNEQDQFRELARSTYSQAYKKKIIAREEYTAYLTTMGYHPDDINLLVQLDDYQAYQTDKLFDLADYRKDMLKLALSAWAKGIIHDTDIRSMLGDLGYDDREITLELQIVEYNRFLKLRDILLDKLHSQYVDYIIDVTDVHTILDMYNYSSEEIDKLMEEWEIEKSYRVKRPPLADLRRFYTQGLLTLEQYLDELRGQGYHEKYISLYQTSLAKA